MLVTAARLRGALLDWDSLNHFVPLVVDIIGSGQDSDFLGR